MPLNPNESITNLNPYGYIDLNPYDEDLPVRDALPQEDIDLHELYVLPEKDIYLSDQKKIIHSVKIRKVSTFEDLREKRIRNNITNKSGNLIFSQRNNSRKK